MEQNLRDLNRLKDKIFQVISHDLKRPMVDLKNLLHILENRRVGISKEANEKFFIDIRRSITLTELLMENLLALGKKYSESAEPILEICSLLPLLLDIQKQFDLTFRKKGVRLRVEAEEDVTVLVDSHMIMTVLRNLISNGIKYTMTGGTVTASYEVGPEQVVVSVSDTGIGMSREVRDSAERGAAGFVSHGTAGETGTGIGLSVSLYFLEKHESALTIESAPGKGTKVSFPLKRYKG